MSENELQKSIRKLIDLRVHLRHTAEELERAKLAFDRAERAFRELNAQLLTLKETGTFRVNATTTVELSPTNVRITEAEEMV